MTVEKFFKYFFLFSLLSGLFFGYIISEIDRGEDLQKLVTYQPSTPTKLFDVNGKEYSELFQHKQELVKFQDIPPHVIDAFLTVEDSNFYNHFGIDFIGITRAILVNLVHLEIKQGGSTLTQQLAKAVLQNRKKTFARKFREALLTMQIESAYTKDEILELYFNIIYLGHGTKGLASASRVYFQTDVGNLSLPEGALLARMPKAPVDYSPFRNPENSRKAHKLILEQMAEEGHIPKNKVDSIHEDFWLKYWPVVITQSPSRSTYGTKLDKAPYFTEYIRNILEDKLGKELLYTGGLKIYTTLDIDKQIIAQEELRDQLKKQDAIGFGATKFFRAGADRELVGFYDLIGSIFPVASPKIGKMSEKEVFRHQLEEDITELELLSYLMPINNETAAVEEFIRLTQDYSKNLHVEGAVITIEPSTGYILTMVGGSKFSPKNQFNRAMRARRQTGSAFKPFVYGSAINDRAFGSGTGVMDAPIMTLTESGEGWSPEDFAGEFRGMVPLSRALALSLNVISVQVYMRVGPEVVIDFASKLTGVPKEKFPYSPALALGVAELTPYEMAVAYSIIANNGRRVLPYAIRYVIDQSGNVIYNREKEVKEELSRMIADGSIQVIPEGTAFILKKMLIGVANGGTPTMPLRSPDWANYQGAAGGKTGSTSSFSDAWYCGFDPNYTTVVWMGFDKSSISLGRGQTGSGLTVPVWGKMYRRFYEGKSYPAFNDPTPDDVIMGASCSNSGLSPKPGVCPLISNMYLKPITIAGQSKAYSASRECDGDKDHHQSMDFREFLQDQYEISDEEINKTKKDRFRINAD